MEIIELREEAAVILRSGARCNEKAAHMLIFMIRLVI
jgi:hypothetical protein